MSYDDFSTNERIKNTIIYNSIILLIFIFWFFYWTIDNISILLLICFIILLIILIKYFIERKDGFTLKDNSLYLLLFLIPFSLYVNVILFYDASITIFIPFYSLVGINHDHNIVLVLIYFSMLLLLFY